MDDPCEIKPIEKTITEEEKRTVQVSYISISGLNCPNCAIRVRNALLNTYGVIDALIEHSDGLGEITYNPNLVDQNQIIKAVSMAGGDGVHSYSAYALE